MTDAILTANARRELFAAVRWIKGESRAAAHALVDCVEAALPRIGSFPESGATRPDLTGRDYRFFEVRGFPYLLVVDAKRSPPAVLHLLHTSRDVKALLGG